MRAVSSRSVDRVDACVKSRTPVAIQFKRACASKKSFAVKYDCSPTTGCG